MATIGPEFVELVRLEPALGLAMKQSKSKPAVAGTSQRNEKAGRPGTEIAAADDAED